MNQYTTQLPELVMRAKVEKGFIAFYDHKGKCMGRRDIDYIDQHYIGALVFASVRGIGPWVQALYLQLIWIPLKNSMAPTKTM